MHRKEHLSIDGIEHPLRLHIFPGRVLQALHRPVHHMMRDAWVVHIERRQGSLPSHHRPHRKSADLQPIQRNLAIDEELQLVEKQYLRAVVFGGKGASLFFVRFIACTSSVNTVTNV